MCDGMKDFYFFLDGGLRESILIAFQSIHSTQYIDSFILFSDQIEEKFDSYVALLESNNSADKSLLLNKENLSMANMVVFMEVENILKLMNVPDGLKIYSANRIGSIKTNLVLLELKDDRQLYCV